MTEPHTDNNPDNDFTAPTPVVAEPNPAVAETLPATSETTAHQPGTTRTWLVGAVLVTAGLVAGSGATYALTAQATPAQGQFSYSQGFPGGGYGRIGGGMGGPPGSTDGTSTAPSTRTG